MPEIVNFVLLWLQVGEVEKQILALRLGFSHQNRKRRDPLTPHMTPQLFWFTGNNVIQMEISEVQS
jgi:hypothetical protein